MDDRRKDGEQEPKKLFTIPTAKDIARLEHGRLKVKSYFKSQFGNQLSASSSAGQRPSVNLTQSSTTSSASRKHSAPAHTTNEQTDFSNSGTGAVPSDSTSGTSSADGGTAPSTSAVPSGGGVGVTRKVGSSFADRFSALREAPNYEAPHAYLPAKRPMVSTAIVSAPVAVGTKGAAGTNSIIVNTRQRGNPILKHIRNIPWEFGDIVPDYVMGRTVCALYLSLRYHLLNPNYIHERLKDLGHHYELRVLLVQVDVKDPHHSLKELARIALLADCTLILSWSPEEAGRYLETYKSYENKSADALKEKIEADYLSKVTDVLSTVRSVNKTDAVTLVSTFGTFDKILAASKEDLYLCPGFGPQKAQRLYDLLHEPFLKSVKDARKAEAKEVAVQQQQQQEQLEDMPSASKTTL